MRVAISTKQTNMNYFTHLECSQCHQHFNAYQLQSYCHTCQAPLLAVYDLAQARLSLDREVFSHRPGKAWRWQELLPLFDAHCRITLGEGDTPLLRLERLGTLLGVRNLYLKDESLNPTGSFKARGLAVAVSKAKELGVTKVIIPTAGNAGGALAAYAARAGLRACLYMPRDTPAANIEESRMCGAEVVLVEGLIGDAGKAASQKAQDEGWFDLSTFKEPYRCEGKKIMGYELAEAFGWCLPEVILYPTGGGTGLIGMWKAFLEMKALGWLERETMPRMVVVQAQGCAPLVRAFEQGAEVSTPWERAQTIATGLRVPRSFADRLILRYVRESNGTAVAVSDDEIRRAQMLLAKIEGIFAAPEGAATVAALEVLKRRGWVDEEERVVLFNTALGVKYLK